MRKISPRNVSMNIEVSNSSSFVVKIQYIAKIDTLIMILLVINYDSYREGTSRTVSITYQWNK